LGRLFIAEEQGNSKGRFGDSAVGRTLTSCVLLTRGKAECSGRVWVGGGDLSVDWAFEGGGGGGWLGAFHKKQERKRVHAH